METGDITFFRCYISGRIGGIASVMLCGLIFLFPAGACAEEGTGAAAIPAESAEIAEPAAVIVPENIFEALDDERDYLSEKIVAFTKQVDQFFGDERYFQENNKSVIQLDLDETLRQGGSHSFAFVGKAKLDLPAAQKRFHLVLESNPEKTAAGEVKKDQPVSPREISVPDQYAAALRYENEKASLWHFSSDVGIKFQFPLDPFVRARGSYAFQLEKWRLKLAESVFWFSSIGLGETTQLDIERVLSAPVLFRATTTVTCLEVPQACDLRQDFSMFHTLNERSVLMYQASVIDVNQPLLAETTYVLQMRYRYRLHKEWVYFEVSPQLNFPKSDDFRLNALLLLRLEMLFGETQ